MPSQHISASLGAVEYTWPLTITETTGKAIAAAPLQLSLGSYSAPGEWRTPDRDEPQADANVRVAQLLVGDQLKPTPGTYWLWSRVTDAPEVVPRRHEQIIIT